MDAPTTEADFESVRGAFDTNPFVAAVTDHMRRKRELGERWIARLSERPKPKPAAPLRPEPEVVVDPAAL